MGLDFEGLNRHLMGDIVSWLTQWLPAGRLEGREYKCGSIQGEPGGSFAFNIDTGVWADFATEDRGSDPIALYAAQHGVPMGEAYKTLAQQSGFGSPKPFTGLQSMRKPVNVSKSTCAPCVRPPAGASIPRMEHPEHGRPSFSCAYTTPEDTPWFYVARYETPANGKPAGKTFLNFTWTGDKWRIGGIPTPRPLYGLHKFHVERYAGKPVLVVEGEAKCEAAQRLVGDRYLCTAWPNGASNYHLTDWSPLAGKDVLLWPDADKNHTDKSGAIKPYAEQPGPKAMAGVAKLLTSSRVKILDVSGLDEKCGWDAADAEADGWTWERLLAWAKTRAKPFVPPVAEPPPKPAVQPTTPVAKRLPIEQDWKALASCNKDGVVIANADNVLLIFEHEPGFKNSVWFDDFSQRPFTERDGVVKPWEDIYETEIMVRLQRGQGLTRVTRQMVTDAVSVTAFRNRRNEPKAYLTSLAWDGVSRVNEFFKNLMGSTQPEAYLSAVSKNFWVSMVARVLTPGCKADNMIILVGEQGTLKSSALSVIAGKWFSELHHGFDSKEFYREIQGKLLIEVSELSSFKKSDIESIKGKLSATFDRGRDLWQKYHKDFQRQCIFAGTTNDDGFLKDLTGNRRFWPIAVGAINLEAIQEQRDQLFAEAVALYKAGANWHEVPTIEAVAQQIAYSEVHPWEHIIEDWLDAPYARIDETTPVKVAVECLVIQKQDLTPHKINLIRGILKKLGWSSGLAPATETENRRRVWTRSVAARLES